MNEAVEITDQDHENKRHHLSLIQATIIRMAANSFLLKGWSVTLIVGLFALATKDSTHSLIKTAFIPCIAFWFLNGYFLDQERRFRCVYDYVRKRPANETDFSLETHLGMSQTSGAISAIFSKTLLLFYGAILLTILVSDAYLNESSVLHRLFSLVR
jgi:hypothetical protein